MDLLIDRVRRQPCLWDVNHTLYRNVTKKDWIWERVAKEAGMTSGNEAKSVWKKLRDSHREALRRRKNMKNAEMKPWKYEHTMRFLLPPADPAPAPASGAEPTFCADDSNNEDLEDDIETIYETIESSPSPPPQPEVSLKHTPEKKRLKRRLQEKESPQEDSLSTLFESLHLKIRRLPMHLQIRVQREIFDSVLRAEEEALTDPLGIRRSPTSSTSVYGEASSEDSRNIGPSSS